MSAGESRDHVEPRSSRNRPRILLVSEFFPAGASAVNGPFQRLETHIVALHQVGELDVVFLWPDGHNLTDDELNQHEQDVRHDLRIEGRIWFVPARMPDSLAGRATDVSWALRGAVSFLPGRPSTRGTGRRSAQALARILDAVRPDLVLAYRSGAAGALLRAGATGAVILDMDDIEHVRLERQARATVHPFRRARALTWRALAIRVERQLAAFCALVLVCSDADREKLQQLCPGATVAVVPNTARSYETGGSDGHVLAFIGSAVYPPNREGMQWFIDHVWGEIRARVPDARLLIAGAGSETLGIGSRPGIEALGFVEDLEPVYRAASVVICPVRRGSGTRIKIVEAALSGRPIVSTAVGAEGLAFEPNTEIALAETPAAFADACVDLLTDPLRAASLAKAARNRARALYSRELVAADMAALCRALLLGNPEPARSRPIGTVANRQAQRKSALPMNRREPKVSIIIGLYNAEAYVARCLESVVGQTLGDIEVILVDDGSRDATLEIAENYARRDSRIRILRQDRNLGQSAALNRGFAEATGTTVRFIDNDDVLPLDSSEVLYDAFERHRPQVVRGHARLLMGGAVLDAPWIASAIETHRARFDDCDQLWPYLGGVWRHLFDRAFLQDASILHSEDVRIGQDHLFNVQAYAAADSISIIEECVYVHDFGSTDSLTRPSHGATRAYRDEAVSLARTAALLRPHTLPYLMDLASNLGYRMEMLRGAARDLDEPSAKQVIAALSDCYLAVDADAGRTVLASLGYAIQPWSMNAGLVSAHLHRGDIDAAYEQLRANVG